jgi:hypothetical protein
VLSLCPLCGRGIERPAGSPASLKRSRNVFRSAYTEHSGDSARDANTEGSEPRSVAQVLRKQNRVRRLPLARHLRAGVPRDLAHGPARALLQLHNPASGAPVVFFGGDVIRVVLIPVPAEYSDGAMIVSARAVAHGRILPQLLHAEGLVTHPGVHGGEVRIRLRRGSAQLAERDPLLSSVYGDKRRANAGVQADGGGDNSDVCGHGAFPA